MITRRAVFKQSEDATAQLVGCSLCDEQNFPVMRRIGKNLWQISIGEQGSYSIAMHDIPYREVYSSFSRHRLFNLKMIDGALIQMFYEFQDNHLLYHRLAFFPSPHLEEYQNAPEIYEADEVYADILMKEIVPFPIRFDYDASDQAHVLVHHPKSHLTLGQYKNCRIPVSGPLTPYLFVAFILRNFYNTAFSRVSHVINLEGDLFQDNIANEEVLIPHLKLPTVPKKTLLQKLGLVRQS